MALDGPLVPAAIIMPRQISTSCAVPAGNAKAMLSSTQLPRQ